MPAVPKLPGLPWVWELPWRSPYPWESDFPCGDPHKNHVGMGIEIPLPQQPCKLLILASVLPITVYKFSNTQFLHCSCIYQLSFSYYSYIIHIAFCSTLGRFTTCGPQATTAKRLLFASARHLVFQKYEKNWKFSIFNLFSIFVPS